jgi:alkylmercury lyase
VHSTTRSLQTLADSLASTFPCCDDAPLALALLDELAGGEPVSVSRLAGALERGEAELTAALRRWPNVHYEQSGRIVAFAGLSLIPTKHRFEVAGRQLYTWCAWDTLFLPALLGQEVRVESTCPVTESEVRLTVAPDDVRAAEPPSLQLSFPAPASTDTADIIASFCCHVHFLAGQSAADRWLADNPDGLVLSLEDAVKLGRLATQQLLEDGRQGPRGSSRPRCR